MPEDPLITTNLVRPADRDEVRDFLSELVEVCKKYNAHLMFRVEQRAMVLLLPNPDTSLKKWRVAALVDQILPFGAKFLRGQFESQVEVPKFEQSPRQDAMQMSDELRKITGGKVIL